MLHVDQPPTWLQNPVTVTIPEDTQLNLDLSQYALSTNPGDVLTFGLVSGPPWATVASTGLMTGTPHVANEGPNTFTVTVTNKAGAVVSGTVIVMVLHVNHPPSWTANPILLPNGTEGTPYTGDLTKFVTDPDPGDVLTFSKIGGPSWLTVAANGQLGGTPAHADVGANQFTLRVADSSGASVLTTANITVDKMIHPPRWRQNPIQMAPGQSGSPYTFSLAPYAVDDDGKPITFSLVAGTGPSWMSVSPDGTVSGTPLKADVGPFTATFQVSDGTLTADAQGVGVVTQVNHPPLISATLPTFTVKERATQTDLLTQWVTDRTAIP